jgi:hypothetical protein
VSFAVCENVYVAIKGLHFIWTEFEHSIWGKLGDSILVIYLSAVSFLVDTDFIPGQVQIVLSVLAVPIAFV